MNKKIKKNKKVPRKKHKVVNERHKRLLKRISDNLGKGVGIGEAMRLEGYSKSYSETPRQLLSTHNWQELIQKQLPDELLTKVHKELLSNDQWRARDAGLDKAYKIKGRYKENIVVEHEYSNLSDEELEGEIAEIISEAIKITTEENQKEIKKKK
ncbi:hypothetical protein KAU40_00550 [Candidatus Parcubacteria bacterium]|nr:hypothetical protein [Candidatus Parcubacteria bacterium]